MIDKLIIDYFQGTKHAELDFCKGVNVIVGTSCHGKSSIIRSLKKCLHNSPKSKLWKDHKNKSINGLPNFVSSFLPKGETCNIKIEFDNNVTIEKVVGKDKNYYHTSKSGKLDVPGTGVPDEVTNLSKINEKQIQDQHSPYFLLKDTPGKRAKAFNSVAGLEIMDKAMSKANSNISRMKTNIAYSKDELKEIKKTIKSLRWVEEARDIISSIKEKLVELKDTDVLIETLTKIKDRLEYLTEVKISQEQIISHEGKLDELIYMNKSLVDLQKKIVKVENIKTKLDETKIRIKRASETTKLAGDLLELQSELNTLNKLKKELELRTKLGIAIETEKRLKEEFNQFENEFNIGLKKLGKCPFCGSKTK